MATVGPGEDSAVRDRRRQCGDHDEGATLQRGGSFARRVSAVCAAFQRAGLLCSLLAQRFLAQRPGADVSTSRRLAASLASLWRAADTADHHHARGSVPASPVSAGRMAVVSRDDGSDDRPGAGRPSGNGRSLRLSSLRRHLHHGLLGVRQSSSKRSDCRRSCFQLQALSSSWLCASRLAARSATGPTT